MNNSLIRLAFASSHNSGSSYLKNFKVAQINLELNRQEDYFSHAGKSVAQATIKRGWRKAF